MEARIQRYMRFSPEHPVSEIIHSSQDIRVVLVNLMPGQMLAPQVSSSSICLLVMEGEGERISGDDWVPVGPGTLCFFPPGELHGIRATDRPLSVLQTLAPLP